MEKGNSYLIKEVNTLSTKIKKVTCIDVTKETYKLQFEDATEEYIEKSDISSGEFALFGWEIIENLGPTEEIS